MSLYLYDETDGENVTVPGDDETDEDVPDEPREAHGDVGDSEGPQHLIIHPAQTDIISGDQHRGKMIQEARKRFDNEF